MIGTGTALPGALEATFQARGGTAAATIRLVEKLGGTVVGLGFVIELGFLNGRQKLVGYDVLSLVTYD